MNFKIKNKVNLIKYFQKIFLLANTKIKIVFDIFFFKIQE